MRDSFETKTVCCIHKISLVRLLEEDFTSLDLLQKVIHVYYFETWYPKAYKFLGSFLHVFLSMLFIYATWSEEKRYAWDIYSRKVKGRTQAFCHCLLYFWLAFLHLWRDEISAVAFSIRVSSMSSFGDLYWKLFMLDRLCVFTCQFPTLSCV